MSPQNRNALVSSLASCLLDGRLDSWHRLVSDPSIDSEIIIKATVLARARAAASFNSNNI